MTQNPAGSDWSARLAKGIAAEIRRHRKARGMSAQQLADRCAELGLPIQRSVLANLESGRRAAIGVAELLVIAKALRVPPVALIAPVGYEKRMEFLPGNTLDSLSVALWISGEGTIDAESEEEHEGSALVLARKYREREWDIIVAREGLLNSYGELRKLDPAELAIGRQVAALRRRAEALHEEAEQLMSAGKRERAMAVDAEARPLWEELQGLRGKATEYDSAMWTVDRARASYQNARENLLAVRQEMIAASLVVPDAPVWIDDDIMEWSANG